MVEQNTTAESSGREVGAAVRACRECGRDEAVSLDEEGVCGFCRELDASCESATTMERRRIQEAVMPLLASLVRMPTYLTAGGRHIEGAIDREPVMVTVQRIRDAIDGVAPSTLGRLMVDR